MNPWLFSCLVMGLLTTPVVAGPKPPAGVSVELTVSVKAYDPRKPSKGVVKCVLRNDGTRSVSVCPTYDGDAVVLRGGPVTLARRKPVAKGDPETVTVEPGKERVLFELPLEEILDTRKGAGDSGERWFWTWSRRPEPPRSPIHKYRQPGYVDKVEFTAAVRVGDARVDSNKAWLHVVPGDSAP